MAYVAVDKNGQEGIYRDKPDWDGDMWRLDDESCIDLPEGSIEKLIGEKMTYKNKPIKVK